MPDGSDAHNASSEVVLTLADVLSSVETASDLSTRRKRDLMSAIRSFSRLIGADPGELPARPAFIRERLADMHPRPVGISEKRLHNLRSDLGAVLRHAGVFVQGTRYAHDLSDTWKMLLDALPDPEWRARLSRFARHCSAQGIAPEAVTDEVVTAFHETLRDHSLVRRPEHIRRQAIKHWNRAAEEIAGWPKLRLTPPPKRQGWAYPWETFPAALQADVENWLSALGSGNRFADNAPPRPLRPASLELKARYVRMFASALVRQGQPIETLTSLADLVDVETFKTGLLYFLERNDGETSRMIAGIAQTLVQVARHHVRVDADHLEELRRMARRVHCPARGMSDRTRARLRQFDDPAHVDALLALPGKLMRKADARPRRDYRAAVLAQMAIAIELLLMKPLRRANLASLKLKQHMTSSRPDWKGVLHIAIPGCETKNGDPIEYVVPTEAARLIRKYLKVYRPMLIRGRANEWLFPGRQDRHKHPVALAAQIRRCVRRETGLFVNIHLYRAALGTIYLEENPGDFETVRRVLDHRSIDSTIQYYAASDSKAAHSRYDDVILGRRRSPTRGRRPRI